MLLGSSILTGTLFGAYAGSSMRSSTVHEEKVTFESPGSSNFFFKRPLVVTSPQRLFLKVQGVFYSDGLLFTLDNHAVLVYISDLSRLNIKVGAGSGPSVTLNSPITLEERITFSLDIEDQTMTLKVEGGAEGASASLTKVLPQPFNISTVKDIYLSGAPDVIELGMGALKARYDYVWVGTEVYR